MKKKGKIKKEYKKEFSDSEIDSYVQEFRRGMKEEHPDENEEVFPNNADQLVDYIKTLEENMRNNPTDHLREELRVYKAHRTGIYKGFCIAYEQLMSEADKVKQEHPAEADEEPEIVHPKEENAYKHDPNYEFKPLTYADIDKYEAISYGPFLGIPWEEFNKMIKKYCKARGRKGKWKTNEFGTQTFYFQNI
jgi:hypothetical protein